ncbi:MAG: 50S ribosomal protein L3 [Deltaproteobacteria bacterium]|nr:50S ribosomal protein L3 [Deltaproteobacteria bacterium]MBI2210888.1 50S ribosomal protein L3 [Deltaproteobacteria bacterium]MBI2349365.1 50S ribosomal protein L3 [Deltaproteobacteria bacterium]MBI2539795.1 50S ribosomal protein L3 [Deltaproteobacteria bacterium]MBI3062771.1 50S ribosomal protein L3 [Deltaproteobacteria bacterium]
MNGLIGKKIGMTQVFGADGSVVPVTVIQTGPCVIVQKREMERDGYKALQVGFGSKKSQRLNKPEQGHLLKAGKGAFQVLREFRLDDVAQYELGQEIKVSDLFKVGDRVDVSGTSKGRGFAGVIKRWGFSGFPASHGTHEYFRHGGAIGNRSYPGRVFKGKRMAGHWGNERISVQNLEVVGVRAEENLLLVKGAVPGARRGVLLIRRSVKVRP